MLYLTCTVHEINYIKYGLNVKIILKILCLEGYISETIRNKGH